MHVKLLVTPLARGAWFAQHLDVACAELQVVLPGCVPVVEHRAGLELIGLDLDAADMPRLARLAFLQAVFEKCGDTLRPVPFDSRMAHPEGLVVDARYPGKTNERMTALALNVALWTSGRDPQTHHLLDPVAGRGTTLLTAARYGIPATGVEREPKALPDFRRIVKRAAKRHRIKHSLTEGSIVKRRRDGSGRFIRVAFEASAVTLIAGDSAEKALVGTERFSLIVGDLPYGIQHRGPGGRRNPLSDIQVCAPTWVAALRPGGIMVLVFNALQPRREALINIFVDQGLEPLPIRMAHRMSESIQRELAVFRRN